VDAFLAIASLISELIMYPMKCNWSRAGCTRESSSTNLAETMKVGFTVAHSVIAVLS